MNFPSTNRSQLARCRWAVGTLSVLVVAIATSAAGAAEIEVKSQANCSTVVRLGDIAEVFGASAEEIARLKDVELGPAPRPGTSQWISIREIQDAMWKRNIDYVSHRITGANRVEVKNPASVDARQLQGPVTPVQHVDPSDVSGKLALQVQSFLHERIDANTDWRVRVNLTDAEAAQFQRQLDWEIAGVPRRPITGDIQGWLGAHQIAFEPRAAIRQASTETTTERLSVAVEISLPPTTVTLRYDVRSGTVLTASHLQTQVMSAEDEKRGQEPLRMDDVVGKELTRTLYAGQPLNASMFRSPQLVKKSDAVTVIVNNGVVRLRAVGIALANGCLGEMIDVQSEFQKEHFAAKVIGPATVEVKLGATNQAAHQSAEHLDDQGRNDRTSIPRGNSNHQSHSSRSRGAASATRGGANQPTSLPGNQASGRQQQGANSPVRLKW